MAEVFDWDRYPYGSAEYEKYREQWFSNPENVYALKCGTPNINWDRWRETKDMLEARKSAKA